MKLLIIRHGQTDVNGTGYMHTIHDPAGLNVRGKEQAHALIPLLQQYNPEIIYTSSERRTVETAEIIAATLHIPVVATSELGERNMGVLQSLPYKDIKAKLDALPIQERYTFKPKDGESWEAMDKRIEKILMEIKKKNYKSVALVTHEGLIRAMTTLLNHEPKEKSLDKHFENGSVTVLDI